MKIKTGDIILSLIVVILLVIPGMLFAQEAMSMARPFRYPMKGVYFSKSPQMPQLKLPTELQNIPPSPATLNPQTRLAAFNYIRGQIAAPNQQVIVPAHVILTPEAPRSGRSYYSVSYGVHNPNPDRSYSYCPLNLGFLVFHFETEPGKTYMADISTEKLSLSDPQYELKGIFNGQAEPQNGHLIIGFTANSMESDLVVIGSYYFSRCELTKVN